VLPDKQSVQTHSSNDLVFTGVKLSLSEQLARKKNHIYRDNELRPILWEGTQQGKVPDRHGILFFLFAARSRSQPAKFFQLGVEHVSVRQR